MDVYGHILPATDDGVTSAIEEAFSKARGLRAASDDSESAV